MTERNIFDGWQGRTDRMLVPRSSGRVFSMILAKALATAAPLALDLNAPASSPVPASTPCLSMSTHTRHVTDKRMTALIKAWLSVVERLQRVQRLKMYARKQKATCMGQGLYTILACHVKTDG